MVNKKLIVISVLTAGILLILGFLGYFIFQKISADAYTPPMSGWPINNGATIHSPAVADINGDGKNEIIVTNVDNNSQAGNGARVTAYTSGGIIIKGFPVDLPRCSGWVLYYTSPVAVADVNSDGKPDVIVASSCMNVDFSHLQEAAKISVITGDGKFIPGWPISPIPATGAVGNRPGITAAPTVTDLNNDGQQEIVIKSWDNQLLVADKNGKLLAGWPRSAMSAASYPWYRDNPPVVAKLPNRSVGIFIAAAGSIVGFDVKGNILPGWPQLIGATNSNPVVDVFNRNAEDNIFAYNRMADAKTEIKSLSSAGKTIWGQKYSSNTWTSLKSNIAQLSSSHLLIGSQKNIRKISASNGQETIQRGWPLILSSSNVVPIPNASSDVATFSNGGKTYLAFGSADNSVHGVKIYNDLGALVWRATDGYGQDSPAIADIDGDSKLEVISNQMSGSSGFTFGKTYVWKTNFSVTKNAIIWGQYLGNASHSGNR